MRAAGQSQTSRGPLLGLSTLPPAPPKTLGNKPALGRGGDPPVYYFLPTTQDTVFLTWPNGYRRQGRGRETDLSMRFHQGVPVAEMDELRIRS